jgi:hypothetical protein
MPPERRVGEFRDWIHSHASDNSSSVRRSH